MSKLYRMIAFVLCACMLLSFAACGEDAPAKDDDITPPVDDTPTTDEPATDEPTEPETPTEPDVPSDTPTTPEDPATDGPSEPDESDKHTSSGLMIDDSPMWNPESYDEIIKFFYVYPYFIVTLSDGRVVCYNVNDFETYTYYDELLTVSVKDTELDCALQIYTVGDDSVLYKGGIPFLQNIISVENHRGNTVMSAITSNGEGWVWCAEAGIDHPDGAHIAYTGTPVKIGEDVKSIYCETADEIYVLTEYGEVYCVRMENFTALDSLYPDSKRSTYTSQKVTDKVKKMVCSDLFITEDDKLVKVTRTEGEYFAEVLFTNVAECVADNNYISVLDRSETLWHIKNSEPYSPEKTADKCKYIFSVSHYLDENHNLWEYVLGDAERVKIDEDVVYAYLDYSGLFYIKADGVLHSFAKEHSLKNVKLPK